MGISVDGHKEVLGLREGTTENTAVAKELIDELEEQGGLNTERAIVVGIDGSKGLYSAIQKKFGEFGLVQRCQILEIRNVLDHLPKSMHASVRRLELRDSASWKPVSHPKHCRLRYSATAP